MASNTLPRIGRGKRAVVAGRTGSGKSTLANWLLQRSPGHWIILNPKWTRSYNALPDSTTFKFRSLDDCPKMMGELAKNRYVIVEPDSAAADHDTLDALVHWIHDHYREVGLCVDELYSLHNSARAGPGLVGWLTRGRELKQSFLGLTQRPAWLSQFLFSESDYIGCMALALEKDRKRMAEMTGRREMEKTLPPHHWLWYTANSDALRRFGPVPIDNNATVD